MENTLPGTDLLVHVVDGLNQVFDKSLRILCGRKMSQAFHDFCYMSMAASNLTEEDRAGVS